MPPVAMTIFGPCANEVAAENRKSARTSIPIFFIEFSFDVKIGLIINALPGSVVAKFLPVMP